MITEFDPRSIPYNFFIIVSSPRKSGKTFLVSHLVKEMKKRFSAAIVISKTSQLQDFFSFCETHIDPQTDREFESLLNHVIHFQKSRKESGKEIGHILVIIDDLFVSSARGEWMIFPQSSSNRRNRSSPTNNVYSLNPKIAIDSTFNSKSV